METVEVTSYRNEKGQFIKGHVLPDDVKQKLSKAKIGNKNALGTKHSKEFKENARQRFLGDNNHMKKPEYRKLFSEMRKGEKSNLYIDGRTPVNEKIRRSVETKLWREAVFTRDDFTCQLCKKRGGKLHPHHILNFSTHIDLRFDVENGITLCESCHKSFHKEHGKANNTKEQVNNFINK